MKNRETPTDGPHPTSAGEAASALTELANDPMFEPRADDLKSLAAAVDSDGDYRGWDRVELHQAFSPDTTLESPRASRLDRALSILAGASVFFPIVWTWWSLRVASDAFGDAYAAGDADGKSFLQMWIDGFDGAISGAHDLGSVAIVSAALVLTAVMLFVLHKLVAEWTHARHEHVMIAAERRLSSALVLTERAFGESITSHGQSIEAIVQASVRELKEAHEETRKATEDFGGAAQQLGVAVNQAQQVVEKSLENSDKVSAGLQDSAQQLSLASSQVRAAVDTARSGTAESLEKLASSVQRIVEEYQGSSHQQVLDSLAAMKANQSAMRDFTAALQDESQKAYNKSDELSRLVAQYASQNAQGLHEQTTRNEEVSRALASILKKQDEAFTELAEELRATLNAMRRQENHLEGTADLISQLAAGQRIVHSNGAKK